MSIQYCMSNISWYEKYLNPNGLIKWLNLLDGIIVSVLVYQYLLQGHQVIRKITARYGRTEPI